MSAPLADRTSGEVVARIRFLFPGVGQGPREAADEHYQSTPTGKGGSTKKRRKCAGNEARPRAGAGPWAESVVVGDFGRRTGHTAVFERREGGAESWLGTAAPMGH